MMALRLAIGMIWLIAFLTGRATPEIGPTSRIGASPAEVTVQPVATVGVVIGEPYEEAPAPELPLDLYGNEVEPAVADYRIDLRGGVYERHSPETAVASLGSPIT